jgi:hypothetical protein
VKLSTWPGVTAKYSGTFVGKCGTSSSSLLRDQINVAHRAGVIYLTDCARDIAPFCDGHHSAETKFA